MIVREFNDAGIKEFQSFLAQCRELPESSVPSGLLEDEKLTVAVEPNIEMQPREFANRAEAAAYLSESLAPMPETKVLDNQGLWCWLSLFYFDALCPINAGRRTVRSQEFYVYYPKDSRRAYYHLLNVPWRIMRMAPNHCRLFLTGPASQQNEVTREVMKRLYLLRIPCIFETLDRLYWDDEHGRPRKGIVSRERVVPGDLRNRFPVCIRQLEKTYDLVSLEADQLIELLGAEFRSPIA